MSSSNKEESYMKTYPRDQKMPPMPIFYTIAVIMGGAAAFFNLEALLARTIPTDANTLMAGGVFLMWVMMGTLTSNQFQARCFYGVPHPVAHPSKGELKSEKDRMAYLAHARALENTLEQMPVVMAGTATVFGVLGHKYTAALCFIAYSIARFIYRKGYTSGHVMKRMTGLMLGFIPINMLLGSVGFYFLNNITNKAISTALGF